MSQTKLTIAYFKFYIITSLYRSLSEHVDSESFSETLQTLESDFEIFAINPYDYPFRVIQLHTFILNTTNKIKKLLFKNPNLK